MIFDTTASTRSFYIHWPFCPYRCRFCPFVAMVGHQPYVQPYHNALQHEIAAFSASYTGDRDLESLYIGGGTPSIWPDELLLDTFGKLNNDFSFQNAEVTIEVNPGTVTKERLVLWSKIGINRLSIGVQSLSDDVMHQLGRRQTAKDVTRVLQGAEGLFDAISVDCILGLPGISSEAWQNFIAEVVRWPVSHISVYFLSLHKETRLYGDIEQGTVTLPDEDTIIKDYYWTVDFLANHGFAQYELSNFAREGYTSRHNSAYWDRKTYKGFGLGAWSFDGVQRLQNKQNLSAYIAAAETGEFVAQAETLSDEQVRLEKIMLGLRRVEGVEKEVVYEGRSVDERQALAARIAVLKKENLVQEKGSRLLLTPAGLLVENAVAAELSR